MIKVISIILFATVLSSTAQKSLIEGIPYANRKDAIALNKQAAALFSAATPAVEKSSKSVVSVYSGRNRLSYGTLVQGGHVLAKASELTERFGPLSIKTGDGKVRSLKNARVNLEFDVAIFEYEGERLPELSLNDSPETELGQMVFLAAPKKSVLGLGVVSVLPRSLRHEDKGFLGIGLKEMPKGNNVMIGEVVRESPAHKAGIQAGDFLRKINGRKMDSWTETTTVLQRLSPGEEVSLEIERNGKSIKKKAILTNRQIKDRPASPRARFMQEMGTRISTVSDEFPNIIQTDMQIEPEDCGAPVTNLNGEFVGIAIARSSRIKTYVVPTDILKTIISMPEEQDVQHIQPLIGQAKKMGRGDRDEIFEIKVFQMTSLLAELRERLLEETPENSDELLKRINEIEKMVGSLKSAIQE